MHHLLPGGVPLEWVDGSAVAPRAVTSFGAGLGVQNVTIKLHHKQLTNPTGGLDDDTQYLGTV